MSRTFDIKKEPYEKGDKLYTKNSITLEPGVTVLVGCNGSGKTTLLHAIKEKLKKEDIPVTFYNNLSDGGETAKSKAVYHGDMSLAAALMSSSEGEQIYINIAQLASQIGRFVRDNRGSSELWFLFDAIDSGFSIDNIEEVKTSLFDLILDDGSNSDIYIVVSANEYEMCRKEKCFDVRNGKYISFPDYEDYRNFILKSAQEKKKRLDNFENNRKKKGEKK